MTSALLALAALGAVAPAAGAGAAPGTGAETLTTSQRDALRAGFVRVRVRARGAATVRVRASVRRGRRLTPATRFRRLSFGRAAIRIVRLRLTRRGRRSLRGCRQARIVTAGSVRRRAARRPRSLPARGRRLWMDSVRCLLAPPANPRPLGRLDTANADRCDFLDPSLCLYPWPNDHFTRRDSGTPTGRRLGLDRRSVPRNRSGTPIAVTDQNRADGFSPGNMIVTRVPGLDTPEAFRRTGSVPITDMGRAFDRDQPVVVINARTRKRQLIWTEIDSNPANRRDVTLIVRPGANLREGERYLVALRHLRDAAGRELGPREEFRAYRDALPTRNPAIEARRAHHDGLFRTLAEARIARRDLYLAWDFTVASRQSLSGRALAIRNDAFRQLGDTDLGDLRVQGRAPAFTQNPDIPDSLTDGLSSLPLPDLPLPLDFDDLDGLRQFAACSAGDPARCEEGESDTTARRITGTLRVPCYLDNPGCLPGGAFALGADGRPRRSAGNTANANVICTVPRRAVDGAAPALARPSLYGHGLLGSAGEVGAGNVQRMGNEHGFVFCATDWAGMSTVDVPNVVTLLQDLSRFRSLADRTQQGYVNFMYLGRWLIHPDGASRLPGFRVGGRSLIDTRRLFYDGNSQGGILSGGLVALEPDLQRAVLGVPGMNYSTLLRRSVDFDMYAHGEIEGLSLPAGLYDNYPDELERPLILSLIQLLWDRGESNGYAEHMTDDPLPGTPPHQVLLHPAFGDHQVANVTAEVAARTFGARARRPALYPGRSPDVTPLYGIPSVPGGTYTGSAIVYWDTGPLRTVDGESKGTPEPPTGNVPPRRGNDPHSAPRSDVKARRQKSEFLRIDGRFLDPCGPTACFADGFAGP